MSLVIFQLYSQQIAQQFLLKFRNIEFIKYVLWLWNSYMLTKGMSEFNTLKAMYWGLNEREKEEDNFSKYVQAI